MGGSYRIWKIASILWRWGLKKMDNLLVNTFIFVIAIFLIVGVACYLIDLNADKNDDN